MGARPAVVAIGVLVVAAVVVFFVLSRDEPDRVVLLGDSIGVETSPYLKEDLAPTEVDAMVWGGTAPCDWDIDELGIKDGDLVVVTFTGNSVTPCMSDAGGGHLTGDALVKKYEHDVSAMVDEIRADGGEVLLVGQPVRGPAAKDAAVVQGLNDVYQSLADRDGVSYVDAGAAVEKDDGSFAADLPCLPDEPECGPSGRNVIRSGDGVHLCPKQPARGCAVYSSGGFRFAKAIAEAIKSR